MNVLDISCQEVGLSEEVRVGGGHGACECVWGGRGGLNIFFRGQISH